MDRTFFGRQLASYAAVHRNGRNKATHFVGIPVIVFSLLLIFALWPVRIGDTDTSMAAVLAIVAVAGWMALDLGIGALMAVLMLIG